MVQTGIAILEENRVQFHTVGPFVFAAQQQVEKIPHFSK